MDHARFSRRDLIGIGGGAAAAAALAALGIPVPARASANKVVTYSDGVGIVDPYGNSLLRLRIHTSGITGIANGQSYTLPAFSPPGSIVQVAGLGTSIKFSASGSSYQAAASGSQVSGTTYTNQANPMYLAYPKWWSQPQQFAIYDPRQGGGGGPNPLDLAQCAYACVEMTFACVALAMAIAIFIAAPELLPIDLYNLAQAAALFTQAYQNYMQQCGGNGY